jgi:hypothetical protein
MSNLRSMPNELGLTNPGYRWVVVFTKRFTKGCLEGLTFDDEVRFVAFADADDWLDRARCNPANNFVIEDGAQIKQL